MWENAAPLPENEPPRPPARCAGSEEDLALWAQILLCLAAIGLVLAAGALDWPVYPELRRAFTAAMQPEQSLLLGEERNLLKFTEQTAGELADSARSMCIITVHFCTINRPVRRHLVLTYFYKFIPVTFGHVDVHIIVPWDKAFISKNTDQSTSGHYISKIMLFADRVNLPEELQKKLLFFCHLSTSLINYFQKLSQSF